VSTSSTDPGNPDRGCRAAARFRAVHLPAVVFAGLLSGCAGERGVQLPELSDWETRRLRLSSLDEWEFRGRVAVKAGEDGFNGNLTWWQNDDLFVASVSGPFGAGSVRIDGDDEYVRIVDDQGETLEMEDAERELHLRYGWTIPVASLRYWALGVPDPAAPAETEIGDDGLLRRLEQRGWVLEIDAYREGGGQPMPRRLTAIHPDTRVRLVIDRWEFR
jgi:outer membrane lipoprotein LolB